MNPQQPVQYLLSSQIQSLSWTIIMQLAMGAAMVPVIYGFMKYLKGLAQRELEHYGILPGKE